MSYKKIGQSCNIHYCHNNLEKCLLTSFIRYDIASAQGKSNNIKSIYNLFRNYTTKKAYNTANMYFDSQHIQIKSI
jgi:hypothetical protein